MKKVLLLGLSIFAFSNEICMDLNKIDKKALLQEELKFAPSYIPKNTIEENLNKKIFFAKKYNQKDKDLVAKLGAIEALSNAYRNK